MNGVGESRVEVRHFTEDMRARDAAQRARDRTSRTREWREMQKARMANAVTNVCVESRQSAEEFGVGSGAESPRTGEDELQKATGA